MQIPQGSQQVNGVYSMPNMTNINTSKPISPKANITETNVFSLHQLASRYDLHNMTPPEMKELSQELYNNGAIGLTELGILTLVPI